MYFVSATQSRDLQLNRVEKKENQHYLDGEERPPPEWIFHIIVLQQITGLTEFSDSIMHQQKTTKIKRRKNQSPEMFKEPLSQAITFMAFGKKSNPQTPPTPTTWLAKAGRHGQFVVGQVCFCFFAFCLLAQKHAFFFKPNCFVFFFCFCFFGALLELFGL